MFTWDKHEIGAPSQCRKAEIRLHEDAGAVFRHWVGRGKHEIDALCVCVWVCVCVSVCECECECECEYRREIEREREREKESVCACVCRTVRV